MAEVPAPMPTPTHRGWPTFSLPFWAVVLLTALAGGIVGLGSYTFVYARGFSYFSDDPTACINCHIMREVYDGWNNSSHKAVATCNDCHTPHTLPAKLLTKAINGFNHGAAFTIGNFPEPIVITQRNRDIAQENCLYCHDDLVAMISPRDSPTPTDCLGCHRTVGHGR